MIKYKLYAKIIVTIDNVVDHVHTSIGADVV